MIVNGTSTEIGTLLKRHINELRPYTLDLSKKNVEYVSSLAIASATIASFSLLGLQINQSLWSVHPQYLISGFVILVINVFLAFLILRFWIDLEEKTIIKSLESLQVEEELFLISKHDPELKNERNLSRWKEIIEGLKVGNSISKTIKERNSLKTASKYLGVSIYINLAIFFVGLLLIVSSFLCIQ